jgi:hypothetical protein
MYYNEDRVLVAVMNNPRDFVIARDDGWYRIPVKHAPPSILEAAVLALYFTRAFEDEKWSIRWYAPILGHELVLRRHILPHQPEHPRAEEAYYKLQIGPLEQLPEPIVSLRWRRITFIETSWDRFITAEEINDLYISGADGFYVTLKECGFWPEREAEIHEGNVTYTVDLAIRCRDGVVPIAVTDRPAPASALLRPDTAAVRRAVSELGGETEPEAILQFRQNKSGCLRDS